MQVELPYGKDGLMVELPDQCATVIEPIYVLGPIDQDETIRSAFRNPVGGVGPLSRMGSV